MTEKSLLLAAAAKGGQRLYLKQKLNDIIDELSDQLTQMELNISQGIPDLAVGLSSAGSMRQLEMVLKELLIQWNAGKEDMVEDALASSVAMSWREERSWAQARERVLEQAIANLLQAVWMGTVLKRQASLTEGLVGAKNLVQGRGEDNCKGQ